MDLRERECSSIGADRRTDGSRLDHVADGEALDRLILGGASRAVAAADGLGVAAALLVAAAVVILASCFCDGSFQARIVIPSSPSRQDAIRRRHFSQQQRKHASAPKAVPDNGDAPG
jgi:hypothetical protein